MGLFGKKKEPDIVCWNCKSLFNHDKVKWGKRTVKNIQGVKLGEISFVASPNQIFGLVEHEYQGNCPECKSELRAFWFGAQSILRNQDPVLESKPFECASCPNPIERLNHFVYSQSFVIDGNNVEKLIIMCPKCNDQNLYPWDYDLDAGKIE